MRKEEEVFAFGSEWQSQAVVREGVKRATEVSKRIEALRTGTVPDRLSAKSYKTRVALEYGERKYLNIAGFRLTPGQEAKELAEMMAVFRTPRQENFHAVYTDKDGVILAHTAISSGALNYVAFTGKMVYDFVRRAERLGAAKVHFIHNHPSGNPAMSRADIATAQMWKNGVANLPGLGDKMGEYVVIDGTTFSFYDWQTGAAVQAHYNSRSMSQFLIKKEEVNNSADVAALGSSLKLGSEEIAVAYLNTQNEVNVCEIHHARLLNDTPEKVAAKLRARAKAFDSGRVIIFTPSFVLTSNLTSGNVKLGDWLLDIVTPSGLSARAQMPLVFEKPSGGEGHRLPLRLFETQAEFDAATPQEVVDRYRDTYIALPEKKGIVQKLKDGLASLPEVLDDLYAGLVDRWGAWEKLALRTGTKLAEKGLVIPAGENIVNCLSFMRGYEGRVRQGITGDHVYLDPMEYDEKTNQMVFSGEAPEIAGDSLVRRLEPLKEYVKQRDMSFAEVSSDLFHVLMPAQRDLELAGEYGNRLPGEIKGVHPEDSKAVITALKAKYGEDGFAKLDEAATSVREWADAMILQPLLRVGMLSQELYEDIKAKNQFYVPFKRLLEGLDDYIAANAGGAGVKGKVIQKIKGSEKQVLDPLEMLIEMAYKANYAYARNRVFRGLYILAKYADMEEIKEVPSKFMPVPVTLKQEIDSVLRPQLERLARDLGFDVKMLHSLGKKYLGLFRRLLNEHEDSRLDIGGEILVRFATTEKTLAHELGHGLDYKYKLQNLLITQGSPEMKRELRRIADQRCGPGTPASYRKYVRKLEEQVAEFVNRFITDRDVCQRTAPQTTAKFEEFLRSKPELQPLLEFAPTARPALMDFYTKLWVRSPFPPEPGTLPYYRQGVLRWLKVPPDIYNAAVNMMPSEVGLLMRMAKLPADLLRTGAVLNPEFISRNPVRDIIQAWIFSSFGFNPLLWFRDAFQLLKKDPAAKELQRQWEAGGGPLATLAESFVAPEKITAEQIADPSKFRYFPHPLQALRHVAAYLENMTRFSVYKQARQKGLTHAEAIHEARRTTLDFSRVGGNPAVRYLGMLIPFFNASIQGVDKLVSELKGPNRQKVWFRLSLLATASILLYLLASRDKRYKELEPWERNYFWHIPLGPDQPIIRIPKPFEAGVMFGSVPVAMLDWALGRSEGKGVKQALEAAWQAAMPEILPTLVRPIVEFQANYDFFRGRAIEDEALKRLPVQLRAKPWTTETAKSWGKHFGEATGISPVMMEHFIRSLGGGLGANYLLPGVDVILRKTGVLQDIPQPAQDAIEKVWGARAFFSKTPTGYRARSVNDFFEKYQDVVQAEAAWKMLLKTGKQEEAAKHLRSHPEIMFARVARKAISQMGDLKGQRDTIYDDTKLTAEQKRAKLDKIDAQLLAIAQKANIFMDSKVADKVGLLPKMPIGQQKKDMDQYSNMLLGPAAEAFKKLTHQWPALANMDEDKRRSRLAEIINTEKRLLQEKAQSKKMKELMHPTIWDRPTKEENEKARELYGTFIKIPTPWKTGFRLKRDQSIP
jgi:proteasome lid subunit RPN8/RPN11